MATVAQTAQWASYSPYVKLTVNEESSNGGSAVFSWKLQYIASSAASASSARTYNVKVGSMTRSGSFDIDGKTGTHTIASGYVEIEKGTSTKAITVYCAFAFNLTWSDEYAGRLMDQTSFTLPAKSSYKITYNANGGTAAPAQQTKWYGTDVKLSTAVPTREGYTFQFWNTSTSGGGTIYATGATYDNNSSVTLYAIWSETKYTITYDANGGSVSPTSETKKYNVSITLPTPTLEGYTFKGWTTSDSSSIVVYEPDSTYSANADATLYAVWEQNYTKPVISNCEIARSDVNGNATDDGMCLKIAFEWSCVKTVSAIVVSWRLATETTWTQESYSESGNSGGFYLITKDVLSADNTYVVKITVSDAGGSTSIERTVGSRIYPIDFLAGGRGVAIGKVATLQDIFEVDFQAIFNNLVEFKGGFTHPDYFKPSAIRIHRSISTTNLSTDYKYFNPLTGDPVADVSYGNLLRGTYNFATYGDRSNYEVEGFVIGSNVNRIRVTGTICFQNQDNNTTLMQLSIVKVRDGAATLEASERIRLLETEIRTMSVSTIIDVEAGDFICLQAYKGVSGRDVDILAASNGDSKVSQLCAEAIG